jgi:outer membrane protein TolC
LALTNDELTYKETGNDIILVSQRLDIVLGLDETILLQPDEAFLAADLSIQLESNYVNQAYSQYPDLKITEMNVALAKNNLKLTNADLLPTLSLQASNTLARPIPNVSPAQDLFLNAWGITLNLSYRLAPLFDRKYTTNIARQQIQLQELAQEQEKQGIRTQVKAAYIKRREAEDRVKALEESLVQANENYRIVKNKYFNQLAILTDLLDANTVQLNAELQLTVAKTNAIYTYYQLQKVSGNL